MNRQKKTRWISFFVFFAILILFSLFSRPALAAFERDLKIGSSGQDVLNLQKILNRLSVTRIVESGPGSPGSETTYFGSLTKAAVIRFQELYQSVILHPIGLSAGTGYVGASTRAKLNEFVSAVSQPPTQQLIPTSPAQPQLVGLPTASSDVRINSITPLAARRGQIIVITGSGFTEANTVAMGPDFITGLASADGKTLSVPLNLSIPPYRNNEDGSVQFPFWVYVQNKNGSSNFFEFMYIP